MLQQSVERIKGGLVALGGVLRFAQTVPRRRRVFALRKLGKILAVLLGRFRKEPPLE